MASHTPSPNRKPQRLPELMSDDRTALDDLMAATVVAHVGLVVDGRPVVMPTGYAALDDHIVIHGSTGSRWMRAVERQDVSVAITRLTGVVVARSLFESSLRYSSAMLFGRFSRVAPERVAETLTGFADRLIPGRSGETRPSTRKELAATLLLEMPIESWSLRVSDGWPEDAPSDVGGDAWAGVVRLGAPTTEVLAAPDLRDGIAVPVSVARLAQAPRGLV